jgi:hypothetical protein
MRTRVVVLAVVLSAGPYLGTCSALGLNNHGMPMPGDVAAGDRYGASVAVSGDTLVVGAPGQNSSTGAVYVFERTNGVWQPSQKLLPADGAAGDQFGFSVATDGTTILVGAPTADVGPGPNIDQGAAYVFVRNGASWEQGKLVAPAPPVAQSGWDWFGYAVAIAGDTAVVGAPFAETASANDAGRAFVFSRTGTTWSAGLPVQAQTPALWDFFGCSVAVSGTSIAVGAVGVLVLHDIPGFAEVFTSSAGSWTRQAHLIASDGAVADTFGGALALAGDTLIVGASQDDVGANANQGSVYTFTRTNNVWSPGTRLFAPVATAAAGDEFGASVAFTGELLIVGAPRATGAYGYVKGGAVFSFERLNGFWQAGVEVDRGGSSAELGTSVSLSGVTVAAGAPLRDASPTIQDSGFVGTYYPAPVVTAVSPNQGTPYGGTLVTITGKYFLPGAWVVIGGYGVEETFVSSTSMTATMPAGTGAVEVRVWNADQQVGSLAAAFLYTCAWTGQLPDRVISEGGGTASVSLTVPPGCSWGLSASGPEPWVRFGSGGVGTGAPQTETFTIDPNISGGPRSTVVTVSVSGASARTFTVSQPTACTYAIDPVTASFFSAPATGSVNVTTQSGCPWDVSVTAWMNDAGWLALTDRAGTGPGEFGYSMGTNNGAMSRSAEVTVVVGGDPRPRFTVTQSHFACEVTLNPATPVVAPGGGPHTVQVTAAPGCAWRIEPGIWSTITSPPGGAGSGNGQFVFTMSDNPTGAEREGLLTLFVSNHYQRAVPVRQPACTYSVSPSSLVARSQGDAGTFSVTTQPNCTWILAGVPEATFDGGPLQTGSRTVHWTTPVRNWGTALERTLSVQNTQVPFLLDGRPSIEFLLPPDRRYYTDSATVTGTVQSEHAIASVTWTTNEGATGTAVGTTQWSAVDVPLVPPDATGFTVTVTDIHGSTASEFASLLSSPIYYLAEGATGLFGMRIAVFNPGVSPCGARVVYLRESGAPITVPLTVPALTRVSVGPASIPALASAAFSTRLEAEDCRLVVDRTMWWDSATGYGGHAETAVRAAAAKWYLAEGATHSDFDLFYLIQNPDSRSAEVEIRYLLPPPETPIVRSYVVDGNSRRTIWVNYEDPRLAAAEISAELTSTSGVPIIVERAMYQSAGGRFWVAGHEGAGVRVPSANWFLAEGATGQFFDMFVLLANPGSTTTTAELTYLLTDGSTIVRTYDLAPSSRRTVWVDYEDPRLENADVSVRVRTLDGAVVIVERAMWWQGATGWYEAHDSAGTTTTGTLWALAEGEEGGPRGMSTWILIANTSNTPGQIRVTLYGEDGSLAERTLSVPASSRTTVGVGATQEFAAFLARGGGTGTRFSALVESLGDAPAQIVVERAMYWSSGGVYWEAGTDAVATKLR